uniref:Uncharacterized protein n=1 Tax=Heterorhabditis bacteriophora TaxID=37862 RepID=A0A1I7WNV4_HETBA
MEQDYAAEYFLECLLHLPVIFGGSELVTALRNNGYHDSRTIANLLSLKIILTMREDLRERDFNPNCNYFLTLSSDGYV